MSVIAGTTAADFDQIDAEDWAAGQHSFWMGRPCYSGASAAWRAGWNEERAKCLASGRREPASLPRIKVYLDSPEWAKYECWWMMPDDLLRKLYVTTWDRPCDEDGDPIRSDQEDADYVRSRYSVPVVLVY